jgi:DNA (cytosine-5)-methyltransferase 1
MFNCLGPRDAELGRPKFIDLFCGIGGMRLAFESANCECVFSSDWDKYAQITYHRNFGELPKGNIRSIPASEIPDHDVLVGGFPCQPFSISGVSKKNSLNRPHGFSDKTQGALFFDRTGRSAILSLHSSFRTICLAVTGLAKN